MLTKKIIRTGPYYRTFTVFGFDRPKVARLKLIYTHISGILFIRFYQGVQAGEMSFSNTFRSVWGLVILESLIIADLLLRLHTFSIIFSMFLLALVFDFACNCVP